MESAKAVKWIRLTIASELEGATLVGQSVHAICVHLGLDETTTFGIELCVVESVTNAIRHGYKLAAGNEVTVNLAVFDTRVEVEVADEGLSMPEANVQALRQGSSVFDFDENDLDSVPEGGMGLQIIHATMDGVDYVTDGKTNRLRMVKNLPEPEALHAAV